MGYAFNGNPQLGKLLAEVANERGVQTLAHPATTLPPEYGTLVPMRYMNTDQYFKVISVSALCMVHYLSESAQLGWAFRRAIEDRYDGTVAIFASGSLSHRFAQNGLADTYRDRIWSPYLERFDHEVVEMWKRGEWGDFCDMLPEYAAKGHGEGFMHDTAMLLGAMGWNQYTGKVEIITPYFPSSGTGQINALFPVTPMSATLTGIGEPRVPALGRARL
jgi:3,4-dihydroxyphenylacetate 2,3-dioxygenase